MSSFRQEAETAVKKTGIEELNLADLAERLGSHQKVEKLGLLLGFHQSETSQYIKSNYSDGSVTSKGTKNMLFDWKKKTPRGEQIEMLITCLTRANFGEEADQLRITTI